MMRYVYHMYTFIYSGNDTVIRCIPPSCTSAWMMVLSVPVPGDEWGLEFSKAH